jgi:hypothetical protein
VELLYLGDDVFAEGTDDLGVVQQAVPLLGGRAVANVRVLENLRQRPAAPVFADHVGCEPIDLVGAGEERRERIAEDLGEAAHSGAMLQLRPIQSVP